MADHFAPLAELIEEFHLEPVYLPQDRELRITSTGVNRPGLALSGFFDSFEPDRIQIIGNAEYAYLESMDEQTRRKRLQDFFAAHPAAVVFTASNPPYPDVVAAATASRVPLMKTDAPTSEFSAALIASLSLHLAPRITRHGVLVEVYGEGVLILGDSGIGKSETAIELVKRGHRLIADDAVDIKKVSAKSLVGSAPSNIRHYAELRGIGIIDISRIFGMGAVKETEKIDMVVQLEPWDDNTYYDRLGLENEYQEIMGIRVPKVRIPVRPGRNLAIIIEIAAMNNREKRMGYNSAEEFSNKLMEQAGLKPEDK